MSAVIVECSICGGRLSDRGRMWWCSGCRRWMCPRPECGLPDDDHTENLLGNPVCPTPAGSAVAGWE